MKIYKPDYYLYNTNVAINNTLPIQTGLLKPKTNGLLSSTPNFTSASNFLPTQNLQGSGQTSAVPAKPVSFNPLNSTPIQKQNMNIGGTSTPSGLTPDVPYSKGNLTLSPYQQSFAPPESSGQQSGQLAQAPTGTLANQNTGNGLISPPKMYTPSGVEITGNPGTFNNGQAPQQQAPVKGLFSDVVSSLATKGNETNPMTTEAYNKAQALNKQLSESRQNQAVAEGQQRLAPIPIGDATGRQQATRNQYLQQQSALSSELQGESNLAGIGTSQQGLQQSALSSAGGLTQPQNIFGTLTDPTTGLPVNPQQGAQIQSTVTNLAQNVTSGKMSYQDALSQLGSYGPNVQNALLQTIQQSNPNFNVNQNIGASSATQNIVGNQSQQIATFQSALQQGQNLQSQLTDLISTFGLNPNDINAANSGLQAIARNTSSPQYKILQNYVNDIANTYAQVLTPTGGSQTDTTRSIASSMLDATASGQSILAVMQSLDQAAQAKIAGVSTTGSTQSNGTSNIYSF